MLRASTGSRPRPLRRLAVPPSRVDALEACLSVLVRMIPEACEEHRLEGAWPHEHDAAIAAAALALYGTNRQNWPRCVRSAAAGAYS